MCKIFLSLSFALQRIQSFFQIFTNYDCILPGELEEINSKISTVLPNYVIFDLVSYMHLDKIFER